MKKFKYLVTQIFDNFDFEKVHKIMTSLNWGWTETNLVGHTHTSIPDLKRIQDRAYNLLKDAYNSETKVSTGGFEAEWDGVELSLKFILEEDYVDIDKVEYMEDDNVQD